MFNDKVRRLARFVKSHDPRECGVIAASLLEGVDAVGREEGGAAEKGMFHCAACNKWCATAVSNAPLTGSPTDAPIN